MKDFSLCFVSDTENVLGVYFTKCGGLRIVGRSLRFDNGQYVVKNTIDGLNDKLKEFANKYRGGSMCVKEGKDDKCQRFLLDIEELKRGCMYLRVDNKKSRLNDILYRLKDDCEIYLHPLDYFLGKY